MTVQAAARNLINFKEARSNDRYWYKKLGLVLDELEASNKVEVLKLKHAFNCALLVKSTDEKMLESIISTIFNIHDKVEEALYPYIVKLRQKPDNEVIVTKEHKRKRLGEIWENKFGKLDDAATQAYIKKSAEALEAYDRSKRR